MPPMPAGFPAMPGLPGAPGQAPKPTAAAGDVGQRCVDDINGYRATKGLAPLARWSAGEACATQEAGDDSRSQRPHGSFGACREASQNACPNWTGTAERMTDDCLRMMWSEGPGEFPAHGHYNNMVDARVTKVACGTYAMPNGKLWAVQDFQ
jgi:Cysteine-rich secretory protein family